MPLNYPNLDDRIRKLMVNEIQRDIDAGTLYISGNLSPHGSVEYPVLLQAAAQNGNDASLAQALLSRLNSHEKPRQLKTGGFSKPPVMRSNAHEMLAEGEFNRFYIRALCLLAGEDGIKELVVFRAKPVEHARSASEVMIGTHVAPGALLQDLRSHPGVDTALGLPPGPNSGLSVRIP